MTNLHLADEGVFRLGSHDYLKTVTGDYLHVLIFSLYVALEAPA